VPPDELPPDELPLLELLPDELLLLELPPEELPPLALPLELLPDELPLLEPAPGWQIPVSGTEKVGAFDALLTNASWALSCAPGDERQLDGA
jgi:hypothetical protein